MLMPTRAQRTSIRRFADVALTQLVALVATAGLMLSVLALPLMLGSRSCFEALGRDSRHRTVRIHLALSSVLWGVLRFCVNSPVRSVIRLAATIEELE